LRTQKATRCIGKYKLCACAHVCVCVSLYFHRKVIFFISGILQSVWKVAVHLGYGTSFWLSVLKLPLKCAVLSLCSVVKQRLKCNTGKVCNCLIEILLYRRSWTSLRTPFTSAQ
jgi:hypothetical protein